MERNTRQRAAIRDAIVEAGRPLLPQEVLQAAEATVPGLSIATVYRNLKSLLDEDELCTVDLPGENTRYETAHQGHHHHFQCLQCQRVFEVDACPGDLASLAPAGFTVEDHDLTLYGRCSDCAATALSTGRKATVTKSKPAPCTHDHGHEQGRSDHPKHDSAPRAALKTSAKKSTKPR